MNKAENKKSCDYMETNIENMIAPYLKFTDWIIYIKRKNHQGTLENAENKLGDFIPASYPGFFQYGRNVVNMEGTGKGISINQNN